MSIIGISGKIGSGKDTVARMIQTQQILSTGYGSESSLKEKTNSDINALSQWKVKRFADKLKDITCMLIGCTREQLEDREFKEKPLGEEWWYWKVYLDVEFKHFKMIPYNGEDNAYEALGENPDEYAGHTLVKLTPRKLMQLLGTEAGREIIHPNIWVNALFADYTHKHKTIEGYSVNAGGVELIEDNWIIPDTRFPNEAKAVKDRDGILIRIERDRWRRLGVERGETTVVSDRELHPSEVTLDDYDDWDYVINNNGTLEDLLQKVKQICKKENIL